MNYKDALFELKHGTRLIRTGVTKPNVQITYLLDFMTKMIEVTTWTTQGIRMHKTTLEQFESEAAENCYEFEIY